MISRLRVATLNVFSGRALDADGVHVHSPEHIAAAAADLDADVLALQEVDVDQPRSRGGDQCAAAARGLGVPADQAAFAATVVGTPGDGRWHPAAPRIDHPGDQPSDQPDPTPRFGVALLSRRPVAGWERFELGRVPGVYPLPGPGRPRVLWLREEPRVVLAARLLDPAVTVAVTHLSFVAGANLRQLHRARAWLISRFPPPYLLLGDLNLPPRFVAAQGWTSLASGLTYPRPRPRVQIDHVLGRELGPWRVVGTEVRPVAVGDHLAVAVDLGR